MLRFRYLHCEINYAPLYQNNKFTDLMVNLRIQHNDYCSNILYACVSQRKGKQCGLKHELK